MRKSVFLLTLLAFLTSIPMLAAKGDVFTAKTVEGVVMSFKILDEDQKTCWVNKDPIDVSTSGTVTIPETANGYKVTGISYSAFRNCTELTRVVIGNQVTLISDLAFFDCTKLSSVQFPVNEEFVLMSAFFRCPALTTVTLPKNARLYKDDLGETDIPFYRCEGLKEILVHGANPYYRSIDGVLFSKDSLRLLQYPIAKAGSSYVIPAGTKVIDKGAFESYGTSELTELTIPASVTEIHQNAFFGSRIKRLVLPEGLTEIPVRMIAEGSLTEGVVIPQTVTTIGEEAFKLTWMKSVELPENLKSIGGQAFSGTRLLESVVSNIVDPFAISDDVFNTYSQTTLYVPEGTLAKYQATAGWKNFTNIVEGKPDDTFTALTKEGVTMTFKIISKEDMTCQVGNGEEASVDLSTAGQVTIPEIAKDYKVIAIGDKGFYNCASLTHIWLHENIERIGELAFYGCTSLRVLDIPRSVTYIADDAFDNCPNITVNIPFDRIQVLPEKISIISITEPSEQVKVGLERVFIPRAVVTIGERTFSFCKSVKAMVVDENNTVFDSREDCNAIIRTADNTLLYGCQNTVIPESVTAIAQYAFEGHSNLKAIAIPAGVTAIGSAAFSGCSGLTSVTSAIADPFGIDDNTFDNEVYQTATLYVPFGTKEKYQAADGWKNFLTIEEKAKPADDDQVKDIIPVSYFNDCANSGIPEGYIVNYSGEVRTAGKSYGSGSRMFSFAEGGDFTKGFYFREGYVLYGALEGYTLPLEKGALYYVLFNTAQWKSSGEWMKFEILNSKDEVVYTQMIKNDPDVNGKIDIQVVGSTSNEIQFVPEESDNYRLKWSTTNAAGTDVGFYEELLANVQMFYSPGPGVWENMLLTMAMEKAKAAREASSDSRYDGDVYTALDNLINQYESAAPATPEGRKQAAAELDAAADAMNRHHMLCDDYYALLDEAGKIIEQKADTKFAASPYYDELKTVYAKYEGKALKDGEALTVAVNELNAAVSMANDMFTYAHSTVGETGYGPLTDRMLFGINALNSLGVGSGDPLIVQAANALADDDELAAKLKQRVTMEMYKRLADAEDGSAVQACNMTVFMKNPNIYKISEDDFWKDGAVPGWDIPNGCGLTTGWNPHGSATVPVDAMLSNWGYAISATQTITDLPVGVYTVIAGFGERMNQEYDPETYFYVINSDNNTFRADCPYIGQSFPSMNVETRGIVVADGKLTIGMKASASSHVFFNNVQIIMTAPAEGYNYKKAYEELKGTQTLEEVDDNEEISFGGNDSEIDENTDLDGTVVGNILYNIAPGNGVYDPVEGCIEVTKATTDEEMDALEGKDIFGEDVRNHFTGIVLKVPAGAGTVTVEAETEGGMTLKVKIGNQDPTELSVVGKMKLKVPYNVSEPSYVYIYAGETAAATRGRVNAAATPSLKIYGVAVEQRTEIKGDVNGDGNVNVGDIMAVINYMAGQTEGIDEKVADVNGDGKVNVGDIMAIINIMAS